MTRLNALVVIVVSVLLVAVGASAQFFARDPGVRPGPAGAGRMLDGLTGLQPDLFAAGLEEFQEADPLEEGLGPRFNLDSCGGCHSQPAIGGTSPSVNPQFAVANKNGATNTVPFFISLNGPIREARFKSDGGVHDLFTITGRTDAPGCNIAQPD